MNKRIKRKQLKRAVTTKQRATLEMIRSSIEIASYQYQHKHNYRYESPGTLEFQLVHLPGWLFSIQGDGSTIIGHHTSLIDKFKPGRTLVEHHTVEEFCLLVKQLQANPRQAMGLCYWGWRESLSETEIAKAERFIQKRQFAHIRTWQATQRFMRVSLFEAFPAIQAVHVLDNGDSTYPRYDVAVEFHLGTDDTMIHAVKEFVLSASRNNSDIDDVWVYADSDWREAYWVSVNSYTRESAYPAHWNNFQNGGE